MRGRQAGRQADIVQVSFMEQHELFLGAAAKFQVRSTAPLFPPIHNPSLALSLCRHLALSIFWEKLCYSELWNEARGGGGTDADGRESRGEGEGREGRKGSTKMNERT